MDAIYAFFQHFLAIFIESAPWLLLGFFIAGIIKALVPTSFLQAHLGDNSVSAIVKGALFGAPLPLCSCGVIPAAIGLRRAGSSKSATTSFLIATPETGVDSVAVTYALLGPLMAIIRPIAAITTAISAGLAVMFVEKHTSTTEISAVTRATCCSEANNVKPTRDDEATHSWYAALKTGLRFTFIDLVKDTSAWLLIGLVMAALVMTLLPPEFLREWGATPYAYLIMALIGVPMYICATASTPIAAGLLFTGVSPGAVLVFLLVGPATNIATLAIVKSELGKHVLAIYLTIIVVMSFFFGKLTDMLALSLYQDKVTHAPHQHIHTTTFSVVCAVVLALLLIYGLRLTHRDHKTGHHTH